MPNILREKATWTQGPETRSPDTGLMEFVLLVQDLIFWGFPDRPDPTDPDQKLLSQRGLMDSVLGGKKRRECYVGNLPQNKAISL